MFYEEIEDILPEFDPFYEEMFDEDLELLEDYFEGV